MSDSDQIAQLAVDLERMAGQLHTQAQQFAVLCVNEGRSPRTINGLLGVAMRTAELLRALHSMRVAARRIEHIANYKREGIT